MLLGVDQVIPIHTSDTGMVFFLIIPTMVHEVCQDWRRSPTSLSSSVLHT